MLVIQPERKGEYELDTFASEYCLTLLGSCSFFQWAEFDDDGEPPWAKK